MKLERPAALADVTAAIEAILEESNAADDIVMTGVRVMKDDRYGTSRSDDLKCNG